MRHADGRTDGRTPEPDRSFTLSAMDAYLQTASARHAVNTIGSARPSILPFVSTLHVTSKPADL